MNGRQVRIHTHTCNSSLEGATKVDICGRKQWTCCTHWNSKGDHRVIGKGGISQELSIKILPVSLLLLALQLLRWRGAGDGGLTGGAPLSQLGFQLGDLSFDLCLHFFLSLALLCGSDLLEKLGPGLCDVASTSGGRLHNHVSVGGVTSFIVSGSLGEISVSAGKTLPTSTSRVVVTWASAVVVMMAVVRVMITLLTPFVDFHHFLLVLFIFLCAARREEEGSGVDVPLEERLHLAVAVPTGASGWLLDLEEDVI